MTWRTFMKDSRTCEHLIFKPLDDGATNMLSPSKVKQSNTRAMLETRAGNQSVNR